jgi:ATP-dependent Lon protease
MNDNGSEFIPRDKEGDAVDDRVLSDDPGTALVRPEQVLPDVLQLVPLQSRPFFPVLVQSVAVDQKPWGEGLRNVAESPHKLLCLGYAAQPPGDGIAGPGDIESIGCVVRVQQLTEHENKLQFIAHGIRRFRIRDWVRTKPPYVVRVEYFNDTVTRDESEKVRAYAMSIINIIKELMALNPLYNEQLKQYLSYFNPNEPSALTDFAAAITSAEPAELQDVLNTLDLVPRMQKVTMLIGRELEVAKIQARITEQMQASVSEQQREFFLRQQLKVIQEELGISKDDRQADVEMFTARLSGKRLPEQVQGRVTDELAKLGVLEITSPEYGVTRNYLDWVTSVPFGVSSQDQLDLDHARQVLDGDHEGLDDVKERIVEFLAVGALKGAVSGSILCFAGPPGVGKTSIGRSIAGALGRKFYRFSLGGMRDEAEIKGHRRTYIGAMPGKLIQALKDVAVDNPVIMFDEIDKVGSSFQGDPASALLEVLDPEQNGGFLDHYLDLRVDLSRVLFVCTANQLDTIPGPLLDRMEVISLAGYLGSEKVRIARRHLWKRQLAKAGIRPSRLRITNAALRRIVDGYAREPGVRGLDKCLARIVRKNAGALLKAPDARMSIGVKEVESSLGPPLFRKQTPRNGVGVVTGLAYTALGGTTLTVEAARIHSQSRGIKLTGQLGDVMRESAEIAHSVISARPDDFGDNASYFDDCTVHLHVPEGATPKDGPSAGITMAMTLLSLARSEPLARQVAMTGELTLTGRVLPVGGIREKVVAARRAGIRELILPADNARDLAEMPESLTADLTVHFAREIGEVASICFD